MANQTASLLIGALLAGMSLASAQEPMATTLGVGNRSCGSWIEARRSVGLLPDVYEGWIAGYLSGSNAIISYEYHTDDLAQAQKQTDARGLYAWIDNYCQAHPLNSIAQAADALSGELIQRARNASRPSQNQ
jgi:hypothetical protein